MTIWLQPWTDEPVFCAQTGELALRQDCGSFQLVKSLYSIGNGGFGGTGLGRGTFTTTAGDPIIPFLNTDFIYSAIAQELGLVGAAGLLLVFMLFVARGFRVALTADDGFSKLLAAGLTFGFALQTFIIVGGVLRVIPLTGITLPFVSYGGSSVVANFILLALLLLVSNRANALAAGSAREPADHPARARPASALIVVLVVATTYWQAWAAATSPTGRTTRSSGSRSSRSSAARSAARRRRRWRATARRRSAAARSTSASTRSGGSPPTSTATRRSRASAPVSSAR